MDLALPFSSFSSLPTLTSDKVASFSRRAFCSVRCCLSSSQKVIVKRICKQKSKQNQQTNCISYVLLIQAQVFINFACLFFSVSQKMAVMAPVSKCILGQVMLFRKHPALQTTLLHLHFSNSCNTIKIFTYMLLFDPVLFSL